VAKVTVSFDTVLEHGREMVPILGRPHFKKYAMHSLLIKLHVEVEIEMNGDYWDGGDTFDTPVTWLIADSGIVPNDRFFRLLLNNAALFSVHKDGKQAINNAYGIEDEENDRNMNIVGREVIKAWKGLVACFAKRFNSRVSRKKALNHLQ